MHSAGTEQEQQRSPPSTARLDADLLRRTMSVAFAMPAEDGPAVATSVRLPAQVHEVARQAVDAGWASSLTELIVTGLRHHLGALGGRALDQEALAEVRSALTEHYARHPHAQPQLAMIAQSAAELEGHPAAERPELIARAVADLGEGTDVEDVLAWVKGAMVHEARPRSEAKRRRAPQAS